jgi:hypothetical protein
LAETWVFKRVISTVSLARSAALLAPSLILSKNPIIALLKIIGINSCPMYYIFSENENMLMQAANNRLLFFAIIWYNSNRGRGSDAV